jgi:radical SAM protein with 4Fe4S-binding SPASM domain
MLPDNARELPALAREIRQAGGDYVAVNRLMYVTGKMGQAHELAFQTLFQIDAPSWKGFCRPELLGDPKSVKAVMEELKNSLEFQAFVRLDEPESNWTPDDWHRYYSDPTYVKPSNRVCRFPWHSIGVCPNGDVVVCPDFPDYVAGNVHQQSLSQIWNGARMRQFRRTLAEHGRFPICSACCKLYVD